jgi:hypothetical protein
MAWTYNDDAGSPVSHLDNVFTEGNAPRFHGMLRSLADWQNYVTDEWAPRYIDVDLLDPTKNDHERRSGWVPDAEYYDAYSILQGSARGDGSPDLSVEQFFHHADILSGQDVGDVPEHANEIRDILQVKTGGWAENALDCIEAARMGKSHPQWVALVENFTKDGGDIWQYWKSPAAEDAKTRFSALHLWYGDRNPTDPYRSCGLGTLAQCLVGFATLIHGARLDIDNLMGVCVKEVHAWNEESGTAFPDGFGWSALKGVVSVVTSSPPTKTITAVDAINTAAKGLGITEELKVGGCYEILTGYLTKADDVLKSAAAGVVALVDLMKDIRKDFGLAPVPTW